jgi:ankyrin repeat protein
MVEADSRIKASLHFFDKHNCCSSNLNRNIDDVDAALALVDEDKMRCLVIKCLTALLLVQEEKWNKRQDSDEENYELVKSKVFNAAISMIVDDKFDRDETVDYTVWDEPVVSTILSGFFMMRGKIMMKVIGNLSTLLLHLLIISEDDIRIMLSIDSSVNYKLNRQVTDNGNKGDDIVAIAGQASILDPKPPIMYDLSGRCALHLVAQYSESLELLQNVLQIDHKMTKFVFEGNDITPLGKLCRRPHFQTFDKMVLCLIEVDSSVEVISDAIIQCMEPYEKCLSQIISRGSSGERSLTLIRNLDANPAIIKDDNSYIFHAACRYLRGELGISVLSLLLTKDSTAVKVINRGNLPIHCAACYSCLDLVKFLLKAYPESISMLGMEVRSLLHLAVSDEISDIAEVKAKVQYLCDQCPALIHLKDIDGDTALHDMLKNVGRFNLECVIILCIVDATVVRDKFTPPDDTYLGSGELPLHSLIRYRSEKMSEVSNEGDCFRLLLRLYPAAAGIKDDESESPYDVAVYKNLSTYFIRLLLSADPTIDPAQRHNLNFEARRQGMFLAFRALSSNVEPTIWAKMRLKGRDLLEHVISYL